MSEQMKEFLINAKDGMIYWKMAVVRAFLYCYVVASNQFQQLTESYGGNQWSELSGFEKQRIYNSCVTAAIVTLVAFLDSTMSKLTSGGEPLKPEDRAAIAKETT